MTQKTIKIFIKEVYSIGQEQNYITKKTDVYHIDDIWSLDILDLNNYGPENNRGYRYVLVEIENFSKFGRTIPLKGKKSQTLKGFIIILYHLKKPNLTESDRCKEFDKNVFQNLLYRENIKHYSKITDKGAVFAEKYIRSVRNLLKKPVFENGDGNWIDILPTKTKQNNNRVLSSTKLTPIQASLKKTEGLVYHELLDKSKKMKPKFQINKFVRTTDLKRTFSKRYTTNWSDKLYKVTEIINDAIPSYRNYKLSERYKEAILKKINLTLKENKDVMKKVNYHHYSQTLIYSSKEEHI